jgi:anti-anti-sigma regulatory factor
VRFFAKLTEEAKEMGREVRVKNMSEKIKKTADVLAVAKVLVHVKEA